MADVQFVTTTGGQVVLDEGSLTQLKAGLRGSLLLPADDGYDAARRVFNAMIDKRPAVIVRCAGAGDVIQAVKFARARDLLVAVRGGGHSIAGKSVCDGGLLIDLSLMKGMRVDPKRRTAQAQPGLRLGEFDRETQAFGLATTMGVVTDTGIAGLTLGGGIGWLNGKYGLACDNLLSADVVTADGELLTASAKKNEDLFWAVRGGGGNLGVVTSFEYQLHRVGPVFGGLVLHPISKGAEVLRFFDQFSRACPDEVSTVAAVITGPDGGVLAGIAACHCGSLAKGKKALKPLREFGPPAADLIQPRSYIEMQSLMDESWPPFGRMHYWKASFLPVLSEDAIEILVRFSAAMPSPLSFVVLQQVHGAASRVDPTATAFPHRAEQYSFEILAQWADPADTEKNIRWAREFWEAMQPFERGVYVNDLGDETDDRIRAAYGVNYDRLAALKAKYDPSNFFRLNQNVRPASQS
jgi:FAD/FMN-containing dehydrogenase